MRHMINYYVKVWRAIAAKVLIWWGTWLLTRDISVIIASVLLWIYRVALCVNDIYSLLGVSNVDTSTIFVIARFSYRGLAISTNQKRTIYMYRNLYTNTVPGPYLWRQWYVCYYIACIMYIPSRRRWTSVRPTLIQRLQRCRRWTNVKPKLLQRLMAAGMCVCVIVECWRSHVLQTGLPAYKARPGDYYAYFGHLHVMLVTGLSFPGA